MLKKEKQFSKQNKGITLISLVVTIIVMLLLTGVGIVTLSGENGLITKTVGAKEVAEKAGVLEEIQLAVLSSMMNVDVEINETKLRDELARLFGIEGTDFTLEGDLSHGWVITVVKNKVSYIVDGDGNIEETEYEEPINNSQSLVLGFVDDLGTRAMIYLYANPDTSINTVGDIITIKDSDGNKLTNVDEEVQETVTTVAKNEEGKLEITGTSYEDAKNYYLAYPVTENGTYTFKATKDGVSEPTTTTIRVKNIEKFMLIDTIASQRDELKDNSGNVKAYSYKGAAVPKGYYVDTKSNVDTGLVITDEIDSNGYSTGNEWVWVPVNSTVGNDDYYGEETSATELAGASSVTYTKYSKLYSFIGKDREDYGTFHPYDGTTTGTLSRPSTTSSPGYREIAILNYWNHGDTSRGENSHYAEINNRTTCTAFENVTDLATQYKTDYESMVTSVDTYKGFYIGRYELAKKSENGSNVAKVQPGTTYTTETWFSLYNKCLNLNKSGTATETSMIYGSLWDATMQWLSSNYDVGYTENPYSGYGNYNTEAVIVSNSDNSTAIVVKGSSLSEKLETGQTSYTISNNIYDLSGNCFDWTQEANSDCYRIERGGSFSDWPGGCCFSASRYSDYVSCTSWDCSTRPQLYIK